MNRVLAYSAALDESGRLLTQLRCNQSRALFNLGCRKRAKGMRGHAVFPNYSLRIYVFDFHKSSRAQINETFDR